MAQTVNYADIITRVIREEAASFPKNSPLKIVSVCDHESGEFFLIEYGRENKRRVDNIIFHARLVNGKVIIETDWIEDGLRVPMVEAGIDPEDIAFIWSLPNPNWENASAEKMAAAA